MSPHSTELERTTEVAATGTATDSHPSTSDERLRLRLREIFRPGFNAGQRGAAGFRVQHSHLLSMLSEMRRIAADTSADRDSKGLALSGRATIFHLALVSHLHSEASTIHARLREDIKNRAMSEQFEREASVLRNDAARLSAVYGTPSSVVTLLANFDDDLGKIYATAESLFRREERDLFSAFDRL